MKEEEIGEKNLVRICGLCSFGQVRGNWYFCRC